MQSTTFGHSGVRMPRLCLGGMSCGEVVPDVHQWVIDATATRDVIARAMSMSEADLTQAQAGYRAWLTTPDLPVAPHPTQG